MVKISVVVPSYNQGAYLPECLGSIAGQLASEDELIVIDGQSNDDSLAVIKRFESSIKYWISEPDGGQSDAVDKGIGKASGDVIVWVNSDDALLPGALGRLRSHWRENIDQVLFFDSVWIDSSGRSARYLAVPRRVGLHDFCDGAMPINQPSTVFSRSKYWDVGGLNRGLHYALDYDLFMRLMEAGGCRTIEEPFAINRIHAATKTSQKARMRAELLSVARERFGERAKVYPTGLLGKYGVYVITRFPIRYLFGLLLRLAVRVNGLPGAFVPGLSGRVHKWLRYCRQVNASSGY